MAMYKVPQDVEAEDKFLGPLTFKQFLFSGGAAITGYLMFILFTKGVGAVAFVFLPFFIFFAVLAFPWNKDQPTDIWLTSRIRFILFPRKRIWDQSGVKNLVTITVPKREAHIYSDGLQQDQVRSRFNALASVIDSRGWATKNLPNSQPDSDRLVSGNTKVLPNDDKTVIDSATDVLDEKTSPLAGQFDTMIKNSEREHREATLKMVSTALQTKKAPPASDNPAVKSERTKKKKSEEFWFLNQPGQPFDPNYTSIKETSTVKPGQKNQTTKNQKNSVSSQPKISKADEDKLLEKVHKKRDQESKANEFGRIKTIQPLSNQTSAQVSASPSNVSLPTVVNDDDDDTTSTSTTPVDPGILALAHNDDLNVETIARQANKNELADDEVVINLH